MPRPSITPSGFFSTRRACCARIMDAAHAAKAAKMNKRRKLLIALSTAARVPVAHAQQGKVWRIGFLQGGARSPDGAPPAALRRSLTDFGYVEGRNVAYEGRWAEGQSQRLTALASDLVQL